MAVETRYQHIVLDDNLVPTIGGTTMKVVELVVEQAAYGWSAEELHFQHPYLTLGQIYSALAYYWDHKGDLDQDVERRLARVEQLQRQAKPTSLHGRLRGRGLTWGSRSGCCFIRGSARPKSYHKWPTTPQR
ncbi:MAG: DUF433 domain-containing protein [Chloroflexi bacterium]|nr:DUF433 domain-containing protein [Chloroflexota bacterium]